MSRDPRSFRELRRLARQAQRNPEEALPVLQDALLETLPAYEKAIAEAHAFSVRWAVPVNVWFFPARLNRVTRKYGTTELAFEVQRAFVDRNDLSASSRSRQEVGQALVVYETTPTKFLVYEDPEGTGRGEVVDRRDGRVMGYRHSVRGPGVAAFDPRAPHWSNSRRQSVSALDTAFLRWMRWWLLHGYTRDQILSWLEWNDPNGAYSDEDAAREGQPPLTHAEAADLAFEHVAETKETLEEMRRNARR